MPTLQLEVTTTPANVLTACQNSAGTATALTTGQNYTVQNVGSFPVYLAEVATAPTDLGGPWHVILPYQNLPIQAGATAIWVRTPNTVTASISVTEAI